MEDMDEDEPIVDIDSCDKNNPLAVTEYIEDVYAHYKKTEVTFLIMYPFVVLERLL